MNENRISIEISAADAAAIDAAIKNLQSLLQPFLIALEAEEKRNLAKIGEKSVSFVEKSAQYAQTDGEFLPPFIDVGEMQKDLAAFNQLNKILRPLSQIVKNLDDTATLCGSEAIQASFAYYNSVKLAAKMKTPKAETIFQDLKQRFDRQKAEKNKPEQVK